MDVGPDHQVRQTSSVGATAEEVADARAVIDAYRTAEAGGIGAIGVMASSLTRHTFDSLRTSFTGPRSQANSYRTMSNPQNLCRGGVFPEQPIDVGSELARRE
jgi:hypothetical protein